MLSREPLTPEETFTFGIPANPLNFVEEVFGDGDGCKNQDVSCDGDGHHVIVRFRRGKERMGRSFFISQ